MSTETIDTPDGIELDVTSFDSQEMTPEEKRKQAADLEGELDLANPDATPAKYAIFAESKEVQLGEMVQEFFDKLVATDLPFAFVEVAHEALKRKVNVFKARAKTFEAANRASNKAHLTPINQMELYETIAESQEPIDDMDD
jgi:hypothetical protein